MHAYQSFFHLLGQYKLFSTSSSVLLWFNFTESGISAKDVIEVYQDFQLGLACTVPESGETVVIFMKINGFCFIKKRFNGFKQVPLSSEIC